MAFYKRGVVGSAITHLESTRPDREYFKEGSKYSEWYFDTEIPSEKWKIVKKSFVTQQERIFSFIDSFEDIVPAMILLDAKRIAYGLKLDRGLYPSTIAISCVYLSYEARDRLNEFRKKENIKKILEALRKVKEGKYFLKMRDREVWDPDKPHESRFFGYVKSKAEYIKKFAGPEVFEKLKEIREVLNENTESGN